MAASTTPRSGGRPRVARRSPDGGSAARARLLDTAVRLFYREGIHSVGVDRIIEEADVTRATFYRHFAGKEALIEAYLDVEDRQIRDALQAAHGITDDPARLLELVIDGLADDVARHHTRGCPFINAAAEYPDGRSAVRRSVTAHRRWFRAQLEAAARGAGVDDPTAAAAELVLLRDAAMVGGYLDGWPHVRDAFIRSARRAAGLATSPEHPRP